MTDRRQKPSARALPVSPPRRYPNSDGCVPVVRTAALQHCSHALHAHPRPDPHKGAEHEPGNLPPDMNTLFDDVAVVESMKKVTVLKSNLLLSMNV